MLSWFFLCTNKFIASLEFAYFLVYWSLDLDMWWETNSIESPRIC